MLSRSLPDLIALAYEASCSPDGLQEFVVAAAGYFGVNQAAIVIWPRSGAAHLLQFRHGLQEAEVADWFAERELASSLFAQLASGGLQSTFVSTKADAGWPTGVVLASVVDADGVNCCGLILIREEGSDFSQADQDTLSQLTGYLHRAIRTNQRFLRFISEHRASQLILDGAPRGILILDQHGRCTYINEEAQRICDNGDGVSLQENMLVLDDPDSMETFNGFLDVARAGKTDQAPKSTGIRVPRVPKELAAYQLLAYPLEFDPLRAWLDEKEVLAITLLHDPHTAAAPSDYLLSTYFNLTPAEAHVTQALCASRSLTSAASELSISVNTARTHLRSVFQKVGVHSQTALVQRVTQSLQTTSPLS